MDREIKFRAIKKLGDSSTVYFTLEDLMRGKVVFAYPEHWHFSQSTGLKDKNGKEIYEGDIVRDGTGEIWIIRYENSDASFIFQNPSDKLNFNTMAWLTSYELTSRVDHIFEIIGNIYENPELLS